MKPKTQTPPFPNTNSKSKKMKLYSTLSSHFCFRPHTLIRSIKHLNAPLATAAAATATPNLTTSLYQTNLGIFSLTWSKSLLSRSLHLHLHSNHSISTSPLFNLSLKPFHFSTKQGIKKLQVCPSKTIWVFWDFNNAKFGSGPEPESGFYIALLSHGEMSLLVGDMNNEAYDKTKVKNKRKSSSLILQREHIVGKNKIYVTKINIGSKRSEISIELNGNFEDDPRLVIMFDKYRLLYIKNLKWKFRGSERIEVDGNSILVSWDVYNWLFDSEENTKQEDGYGLFTFRVENNENDDDDDDEVVKRVEGVVSYSQDSCGINFERKKMKKRMLIKSRSPSFSSSSLSSISSASSSVLEWQSVEENELNGPNGFSLLVYAWKS